MVVFLALLLNLVTGRRRSLAKGGGTGGATINSEGEGE